jgi:TRAP-type mannitol/chloroaromatic compound transport system permease large subunit
VLVIYAILTEQNIAKLFLAAFIPGILAMIGYMIVVAIYVRVSPGSAGKLDASSATARPARTANGTNASWPKSSPARTARPSAFSVAASSRTAPRATTNNVSAGSAA